MKLSVIMAIAIVALLAAVIDQCDVMTAPGHPCDEVAMPWLGCDK